MLAVILAAILYEISGYVTHQMNFIVYLHNQKLL